VPAIRGSTISAGYSGSLPGRARMVGLSCLVKIKDTYDMESEFPLAAMWRRGQ
jgi:hypothetical protein